MIYLMKYINNVYMLNGVFTQGMKDTHSELEGLRALDPETITDVHNRFYPAIYRFLIYRIGNEETAEDLAAEVFVRLLEALHAGRGPDHNLRGWLMGTAANMANDHYRRHYARSFVELSEELESGHNDDPYIAAEKKDDHRLVKASLEKLTEDQKQVLALRFGSGFSLEETAEAMGKKANAIKALQFRALEALRRGLGEVAL